MEKNPSKKKNSDLSLAWGRALHNENLVRGSGSPAGELTSLQRACSLGAIGSSVTGGEQSVLCESQSERRGKERGSRPYCLDRERWGKKKSTRLWAGDEKIQRLSRLEMNGGFTKDFLPSR